MPLWLFWLLLGLIAGSLAKFLVPGRDPAGCIFTIALGVVGAALARWTNTAAPYADSTLSTTSLVANWLLARKVLEN